MDGSFIKIKSRHFRNAVIISSASGIGAGLTVSGALLLAFKLASVQFFWVYYLLIGLGTAAAVFGVLFLVLHPKDSTVAKKLDREYGLNEKVQTMVEFDGQEGEMLELQRRDAVAHIEALPRRKVKAANVIKSTVLSAVALGIFLTGVIIPSNAENIPVDPEEPPFVITDWQKIALGELINNVGASDLKDEIKVPAVTYLEALVNMLEDELPASRMTEAVETTMSLVKTLSAEQCSGTDIAEQFALIAESSSLEENVQSTINGFAESFGSLMTAYGEGKELTSYDVVVGKCQLLIENVTVLMGRAPSEIYDYFADDEKVTVVTHSTVLKAYTKSINDAVAGVRDWDEDVLLKSVKEYSSTLDYIAGASGYTLNKKRELVNEAGEKFVAASSQAAYVQAYSEMMCEFVRRRLANIFGIAIYDPPEPDETDKPEDPGSHGGGGGNQGIIRGSKDTIYDPGDDQYKEYGDVLEKYYAAVMEIMEGEDIPEELKLRIKDYFRVLGSGF